MPKFYQIKITNMWHKVKELTSKGLKPGQISLLLGVHRDTVRKYKNMNESEMHRLVERPYQNRKKLLAEYTGYVTGLLKRAPYLTSPQVHDRLKENYEDLPEVSDKTVYNFVTALRQSLDIPQCKEEVRQMCKLPDPDYGKEAQVDWGEKNMMTASGHWKKVYFFTMVMSRSRHKFVYFQDVPFTAATTAYAHHLAFEFFGGVPERVLYDQDCVLIVSENLGDYQLTAEMEAFVKSAGYTPVFCRPADPQSKGKVENVVGFVKNNFIKGRRFTTVENLNAEARAWLERTGNGHRHATTRLIPLEEFKNEQPHLRPYTARVDKPRGQGRLYNVRRDNTICYKGCLYSLPLGTYAGDNTRVMLVDHTDREIELYSADGRDFLISYQVSLIKGRHVTKSELSRVCKSDPTEGEECLVARFRDKGLSGPLERYLQGIRSRTPRYYNAAVKVLRRLFVQIPDNMLERLLDCLLSNKVDNAYDAVDIADAMLVRSGLPRLKDHPSRYGKRGVREQSANMDPQRSDIATYDDIINKAV